LDGLVGPNAVVAVCGNALDANAPVVLETSTAIAVDQSNTKLCCAGLLGTCILQAMGTDNVLNVLADSVTLQELVFVDGVAQADANGGNVLIDGGGSHLIVGCEFRGGVAAALGGNLYVSTFGDVTLFDSTFAEGTAGEAGGGVYIVNAASIEVATVDFTGNSAGDGTGGGFFSTLDDAAGDGQDIFFNDTIFADNEANIGGGFFVTQLGALPSLRILNCNFENNQATEAAGAGASAESLDNLDLEVTGSTGNANAAPVCPNLLGFFDDSTSPVCIELNQDFP
jgi:hypothetical protein